MPGSLMAAFAFGAVFFLLLIGVPVGFAFIIVGLAGSALLIGVSQGFSLLVISAYSTGSSYILATVPLFVLMGIFASEFKYSKDLYWAAYSWFGKIPGGLAIGSIAGCAIFAALTGSSAATAVAMGTISWNEMKKYKYDPGLALGTIAAAGSLGILIPPSIGFIVYGILTEESIGKLFIAGVFPGLLEVVSYSVLIFILVRLFPSKGPLGQSFSWRQKALNSKGVAPVFLIILVVLGGLYLGFFTPSEAGAVGASCVLIVGLIMRRVKTQRLFSSFRETIKLTGMIFLIIVGVTFFNSFMAMTQMSEQFVAAVSGLPVNRYLILAIILALYLPLGMFVDAIGMLVLTLPFVYPLMTALGFDGIWIGVLLVRMMEIGLITPPLGINLFTLKAVAPEVPLNTIMRGCLPFVLVDVINVAILVSVPQIALFLPNQMG